MPSPGHGWRCCKCCRRNWPCALEHAQFHAALQQEIEGRKQAEAALQHALAKVAQLQDQLQAENVYLRDEMARDYAFEEIVGHSPALRHVLHQVERVAVTDTTVLILGETGTGKELIARAIHHHSARKDRPLVKVNCAAFTAWTKVQLHRPAHAQKICEPSSFHLPSTEEDTIGCPFVTMAKTLKYGIVQTETMEDLPWSRSTTSPLAHSVWIRCIVGCGGAAACIVAPLAVLRSGSSGRLLTKGSCGGRAGEHARHRHRAAGVRAEIRAALGDAAAAPGYVATVGQEGYCFLGGGELEPVPR